MPGDDDLAELGWRHFAAEPALAEWVQQVLPHASAAVADPAYRDWLRCGGTWFAGVNALANDPDGRVAGSGPLPGRAVKAARRITGGDLCWDRGQISVVYPGYPRQGDESDAAFRFRLRRDAAHVDGLIKTGRDNRRMLREPHAFVLGLPLTESDPGASPVVVWQGSPAIVRNALQAVLADHSPERWPDVDLTEAYTAARRRCFETCRRVSLHARPGEAYLIHRLALHGVSPWGPGANAAPEGRMIAYFRPLLKRVEDWLVL